MSGDELTIRVAILTISDRASRGEYQDKSGPLIRELLSSINAQFVYYDIFPDEKELIAKKLIELSDNHDIDLIVTTGGTGLGPRDVTPEATLEVIDKRVPGLEEAMRYESMKITPYGMLSRAVCGVRKRTLIINLPGSVKAVKETLSIILPALRHAIEIINGISNH